MTCICSMVRILMAFQMLRVKYLRTLRIDYTGITVTVHLRKYPVLQGLMTGTGAWLPVQLTMTMTAMRIFIC